MSKSFSFWGGSGRATYGHENVEVGDRLVPTEIYVEVRGGLSQPDLKMKIEVREGIPIWTSVCIQARPNGPEVREKDLAQIQLADWLEHIVGAASMKYSGQFPGGVVGWAKPVDDHTAVPDIRRARAGRTRMTQERLEMVAETYRKHIGNRPTEAVQRTFGLGSHRTAARYVQQARQAGLLPDTTPGKKKA